MKIIIPLAGWGTRVRPHTYSKPKSLIEVAGKPVLAHILDELAVLCIEEIIFITGQMGEQVEHYVAQNYPQYRTRYLQQEVMSGQSIAVYLAKDFVPADLLIIFSDTIFKTDLATLADGPGDGVLHVKEVRDPARFGVAVLDETWQVKRLVEKPTLPVSNLAVVGVYYFKNAPKLFKAIETQLKQDEIRPGGEYYLADALEVMIKEGAVFQAREIELWEDCGTIPALLETNRQLLALQTQENGCEMLIEGEVINSVVIPPVCIGAESRVVNSVIGPNVSVSGKTEIRECIIKESLIGSHTRLNGANLAYSVIGSHARVERAASRLNISDNSELIEA